MKRALLSSSLPVPRSTADENSNHNHFIIEDSFTVQLTFSDGSCSSSIYLLAQRFSTWGTCSPRGTFAYPKRNIYLHVFYFQIFIHIPVNYSFKSRFMLIFKYICD